MTMGPNVLAKVYGLTPAKTVQWWPHIKEALSLASCDTDVRCAYWLAQVGHESGCLRFLREIWGPTPQQLRYEPPSSLALRLGNTNPGDGAKYKGYGLIQLTGKANCLWMTGAMRKLFGDSSPDFVEHPEYLMLPRYAALSASIFWNRGNLNRFSDSGDLVTQTKRINGGLNGLAHRQALLNKALLCFQS